LSFKHLFSRSLGADPQRLHFAAHSHHLWPDVSFDGHVRAWEDAALLADRKWDKVMGELWPAAQAEVAAELGTGEPDAIVFAPNTHELLVRLFAAGPWSWPIRVLTSDGEFHSARRQFARWRKRARLSSSVFPLSLSMDFPSVSSKPHSLPRTTSSSSARCCSAAGASSIGSRSWRPSADPTVRGW
jgi:selenocysteine lyase/cysteine desulfurase